HPRAAALGRRPRRCVRRRRGDRGPLPLLRLRPPERAGLRDPRGTPRRLAVGRTVDELPPPAARAAGARDPPRPPPPARGGEGLQDPRTRAAGPPALT